VDGSTDAQAGAAAHGVWRGRPRGPRDAPLILSEGEGAARRARRVRGRHWRDRLPLRRWALAPAVRRALSRSYSVRSGVSFNSMATEEVVSRLESDKGIYGWQRKGLEDWRIFWIGGMGEEQRTDDDD
jgi:hypothetical protein